MSKFTKGLMASLMMAASIFLMAATTSSEYPQELLYSEGSVNSTTGSLLTVPNLGSSGVTYAVVVINADDADDLYVAEDVFSSDAAGMPAPSGGITNLTKTARLTGGSGETANFGVGVQRIGLRCATNDCDVRVFVTYKKQ